MSANLRKFVNQRFIKTIDLGLIRRFLCRYNDDRARDLVNVLAGDDAEARDALKKLLSGPEDKYPEALRADLHRIAALGSAAGLEMIIEEARRRDIDLFPDLRIADDSDANPKHDPKHIALRVFLDHNALFDSAADQFLLRSLDRFASFMGATGAVMVDLTDKKLDAFRSGVGKLFKDSYQGDYCRIGSYLDAGEINLVITHGSVVSTLPVIKGEREEIITIRSATHSVLRYSEVTGTLRVARFQMALRQKVADLFAEIVLEQPGVFAAEDSQNLYTLRPVERDGASFAFRHAWDEMIERVAIISATATLNVTGTGKGFAARSMTSTDPRGKALTYLPDASVRLDTAWRLSELKFRVFFKGGRRRAQVTVTLRPPRILQYRSAEHEGRILELLARNGLTHERHDHRARPAAE